MVLAQGVVTARLTLLDTFRKLSRLRAAFLLPVVDKVKFCAKITLRCKARVGASGVLVGLSATTVSVLGCISNAAKADLPP